MTGHKTVKVRWPFIGEKRCINIDKDLAPLIRLIWDNGIPTQSSCQEWRPGLAMIGFCSTDDVQEFLLVGKRNYIVEGGGGYYDWQGRPVVTAFLSVLFPITDIPQLIEAFKVYEEEIRKTKDAPPETATKKRRAK